MIACYYSQNQSFDQKLQVLEQLVFCLIRNFRFQGNLNFVFSLSNLNPFSKVGHRMSADYQKCSVCIVDPDGTRTSFLYQVWCKNKTIFDDTKYATHKYCFGGREATLIISMI